MGDVQFQRGMVRSIRLDEAALTALLDRLDESETDSKDGKRLSDRFKYRRSNILLQIQQPGDGTPIAFHCPTRNLSENGMSILHGGFVHSGSRCVVQLISSHGAWENVPGTVVACNYLQAGAHEVHLRFDHRIDPGMYCPDAVRIRVLVVDDDKLMARLIAAHLMQLSAEAEYVEDGSGAIDLALKKPFDVILMDMEMPLAKMDGFGATRELRKRGYSGTIVALTGLTGAGDKERCLEAGCDHYLTKPTKREDLAALFASLKKEPLFSSLADEPMMSELVTAFVQDLPRRLRAVEEARATKNVAQLLALVRSLKSEAGGCGFDPISDAAAKVEKMLHQLGAVEKIQSELGDLANWCQLARTSSRESKEPTTAKS